jgi:hypothetical protein
VGGEATAAPKGEAMGPATLGLEGMRWDGSSPRGAGGRCSTTRWRVAHRPATALPWRCEEEEGLKGRC